MRFQKRTPQVDAVRYEGGVAGAERVMDELGTMGFNNASDGLYVMTPGGVSRARKGDWVIRWEDGGFQVMDPELFEKTFERVEER